MPIGNVSKGAAGKFDPNRAIDVRFDRHQMTIRLGDGRELAVPLRHYPTLRAAKAEDRNGWELIGRGTAIHWESLDLDLSVDGLLNGLPEHIPRPPTERPPKIASPSVGLGRGKPRRVG